MSDLPCVFEGEKKDSRAAGKGSGVPVVLYREMQNLKRGGTEERRKEINWQSDLVFLRVSAPPW
jgi:hypothetical protein